MPPMRGRPGKVHGCLAPGQTWTVAASRNTCCLPCAASHSPLSTLPRTTWNGVAQAHGGDPAQRKHFHIAKQLHKVSQWSASFAPAAAQAALPWPTLPDSRRL